MTSLNETAEPIMNATPTPIALPTPVGARDSSGEHFSVELDQVLTDWLTEFDAVEPREHIGVARV